MTSYAWKGYQTQCPAFSKGNSLCFHHLLEGTTTWEDNSRWQNSILALKWGTFHNMSVRFQSSFPRRIFWKCLPNSTPTSQQQTSILVHQHVNTNLFLCPRQIKSSTTQDRGSAYLSRLVLMVQSKHKMTMPNTFQSDAQPTKKRQL